MTENPLNPYAKTKLEVELLAKKYSEMGVHVIGLRYFKRFWKKTIKRICWGNQAVFRKNSTKQGSKN